MSSAKQKNCPDLVKTGTGSPHDTFKRNIEQQARKSITLSYPDNQNEPPSEEQLEHRFLDVGTYSCGSVFGLGERMQDRSIVARNHVQCMLIPRYWLFMKHQNTGNVWQRIKMYLDLAIPSREQLFKKFLDDINWMAYRKKVVNEIIQRRGRQNHTRLVDVPIVCRVEQSDVGQR